MKNIIVVLLLIAAAMGQRTNPAQDHAPTAEQCRADMYVWLKQSYELSDTLSMRELDKRKHEMFDCESVFLTNSADKDLAADGANKYILVEQLRLESFLKRHNLIQQFVAEDDAGAR